jgi:single-strand DNA-binding protein
MSSINKVILVGHLGKNPELRYLPGDVAVVSFPLATTEFIMKDGVRCEQTDWHNIVIWRSLAESAARYLEKGKLIYVEGKCKTRSFEKDGIKRYTTEIVVDTFTLLGRKSDFEETNDQNTMQEQHS